MKAIVYREFGSADVLRLEEIDRPAIGDDHVLLRVRAAAANPLDWRLMRGAPLLIRVLFGMRKPKLGRPGRDVAGEVEAAGRNVTRFRPGDAVFGTCDGAFAEYACAAESALAAKPTQVSFEQAAAVPVAGLTALQGLRDHGQVRSGQRVLINGAAGGVGTFAVQIAKSFGAEVTGVCSTKNVELVRSLGAARVVDYTQTDFTREGMRYDVILDCAGNHPPAAVRRALVPRGRCVLAGGVKELRILLTRMLAALVLSRFVSQTFVTFVARNHPADLGTLRDLVAAGTVRPVIDRTYALREAAKAIRYLEEGHARGKVILTG